MYESIEEKSIINERREVAPGSIDLQVIERKQEPRCALCASVCVHIGCAFAVLLDIASLCCTCIENVTDLLVVCLVCLPLTSTGSIFQENGESSLLQTGLQVYQ